MTEIRNELTAAKGAATSTNSGLIFQTVAIMTPKAAPIALFHRPGKTPSIKAQLVSEELKDPAVLK